MSQFRWRIVVLDDNGRDLESLRNVLQEVYGVTVATVKDPESFFGDSLDAICSCHVALVDMAWENFPNSEVGRQVLPNSLWEEDNALLVSDEEARATIALFVKRWILAIQAWSSSTRFNVSNEWPRSPIGVRDVGLWLGALISHVNSECEIVLFSGNEEVGNTGQVAALGRFRDPKYRVLKKNNAGGIDAQEILPSLAKVQARLIERDIVFREWFLGGVLVPLIVGGTPQQGQFRALMPFGVSMQMDLDPEVVFPQLASASAPDERVKMLLRFLPKPLLQSPQRVALETALHELDQKKLDGLAADTLKTRVWQLLPLCFHAGDVGISMSKALIAALTSYNVNDQIEALRIVWQDAFSMLFSARYSIAGLCEEYSEGCRGRYTGADDLRWPVALSDKVRKEHYEEPQFRGNMVDLRSLVLVFRDNAKREGAEKWCLNVRELKEALIISWLDDSKGFLSAEQFRAAVQNSVKKGVDRGFPGAFASALRLGATEFWVLAGEGEKIWQQLFPGTQSAHPVAEEGWARYGFRLKLAKSK